MNKYVESVIMMFILNWIFDGSIITALGLGISGFALITHTLKELCQ